MKKTLANLNYLFALWVVGSTVGLKFVAPSLQISLMRGGIGLSSIFWGNLAVVIAVFLALVFVWKKNGALMPVATLPRLKVLYFGSIGIVALSNAVILLAVLIAILGPLINRDIGLASPFLIAVALIYAVPANIVGIIGIEVSRKRR